MSYFLRIGCSFRTSLTILKRFPECRTCQHLRLHERGCANSRLLIVKKSLTEFIEKASRVKEISSSATIVQERARVKEIPKSTTRKNKLIGKESDDVDKRKERIPVNVTSPADLIRYPPYKNDKTASTGPDDGVGVTLLQQSDGFRSRIENSAPGTGKTLTNTVVPKKKTSLNKLLTELEHLDITSVLNILTLKGKTQDAMDILYDYLYICNKLEDAQKPDQMYHVDLFNIILRALAIKGNIERMETVLIWMRAQTVAPTLQTYAHFLECLGRSPNDQHSKIQGIVNQLQKEGLEVEDLYRNCRYICDEWSYVRKAVDTVQPNFEPRPCPEKRPYNNPLLTHLDTAEAKQAKIFNPNQHIMKEKKMSKLISKRLKLEKDTFIKLTSVKKIKGTSTRQTSKDQLREVNEHWEQCLKRIYHNFMNQREQPYKEMDNGSKVHLYLHTVTDKEFANIIIEVVELMLRDSLKTVQWTPKQAAKALGRQLMLKTQYFYMDKYGILEKVGIVYKEYARTLLSDSHMDGNHREIWEAICNRHMDGPTLGVPQRPWSNETQLWVGQKVLQEVMKVLTINLDKKSGEETVRKQEPAFFETLNRNLQGKCLAVYMPHPSLLKIYKKKTRSVGFQMSELPSTIPPVPWTSVDHGVHLLGQGEFVRKTEYSSFEKLRKAIEGIPSGKILSIFDVLNYMGSIPWILNKSVLDVQMKVFQQNGNKQMNVPIPSSPIPEHLKSLKKCKNSKDYRERLIEKYMWKKKSFEMNSIWYSCLWMLTIANEFRDKVFWLPLNLDYRGRVYTLSSILQYYSNDMTRSLFLFAKGKPLGEKGLDWLKIHIINLTGSKKKRATSERLAYANQVMEDILDSADNPLDGRQWWLESDEPWQTLACCKEIAAAVRSEDHTKFVSHFPVHQDGSCNGLQHYAALGRDKSGAGSVNLDPSDLPRDVYSDIMDMVELQRQEDEKDGMEIAKFVAPYITRKVVKRPVMTSVYGVTAYGASLQVRQVLKEVPGFPQERLKEASSYISKRTMSNLKKRFEAARTIQEWFGAAAQTTSASLKRNVEWKTPLGLRVIQPYDKRSRKKNRITKEIRWEIEPNTIKQKNSFPPNYIHSLDSVHMMLTALHCMKENITFSSVHDCFWTHACDIDTMNKICREQFVVLHSQPLLEQLSKCMLDACKEELTIHEGMKVQDQHLLRTYANVLKSNRIKLGDFDLKNVLESEYFFS